MPSPPTNSNTSAPPSPTTATTTTRTTTSTKTDPAREHNSLDDIFSTSPPKETSTELIQQPHTEPTNAPEPSDLPSLRRQHVTAGYRDGVSTSKAQHVQRGFDAGFPVGAQMGMRAGTVVGILEGVLRGLERSGSVVVKKPTGLMRDDGDATEDAEVDDNARRAKREQVRELYQLAMKELEVQSVFAGAGDGSLEEISGNPGEEAELQLAKRGDKLISMWEGRVAVPRWEENMEGLEEEHRIDEGGMS